MWNERNQIKSYVHYTFPNKKNINKPTPYAHIIQIIAQIHFNFIALSIFFCRSYIYLHLYKIYFDIFFLHHFTNVIIYFIFIFPIKNVNFCCGDFPICMNEANKSQESNRTATNVGSKQSKNAVESEFVSDAFQTTDKDLDEVKAGMKLLGIDSLTSQSNKNDGKTV